MWESIYDYFNGKKNRRLKFTIYTNLNKGKTEENNNEPKIQNRTQNSKQMHEKILIENFETKRATNKNGRN